MDLVEDDVVAAAVGYSAVCTNVCQGRRCTEREAGLPPLLVTEELRDGKGGGRSEAAAAAAGVFWWLRVAVRLHPAQTSSGFTRLAGGWDTNHVSGGVGGGAPSATATRARSGPHPSSGPVAASHSRGASSTGGGRFPWRRSGRRRPGSLERRSS